MTETRRAQPRRRRTDFGPAPRHLSLTWRILGLLTLLLTGLHLYQGLSTYEAMSEQQQAAELADMRRSANLLDRLLDQSAERLAELAAQISATVAADTLGRGADFVASELVASLYRVDYFSAAGEQRGAWSIGLGHQPLTPRELQQSLHQVSEQQRPVAQFVCRPDCVQYVLVPTLDPAGNQQVVGIGRFAGDLMLDFQELTGTDLALLATVPRGSAAPVIAEFGSRRVMAVTRAPELTPVLRAMPETRLDAIDREPERVDQAALRLLMAIHPLASGGGQQIEALLLRDMTEPLARIEQQTRKSLLRVVLGLLASIALLAVLLVPELRRLARVTQALPMLANRRFEEARTVMGEAPKRRFQDEVDQLRASAIWLSRRMEHLIEAEAAGEAKSRYLATVSHEIRTPLNGILGLIDLLERSALDPDQRDQVRVIRESAVGLRQVIDGILNYSKIEAGKLELEAAPVALCELIESAAQMISASVDPTQVRIIAHVDPRLPEHVVGDGVRLRQVLNNLCSNAAKFTQHGRIVVRAEAIELTPASVRLHVGVRDSGIGIPDSALGELFRPYTQAESSTSREFGGTGLGLSICKGLIEQMGGVIGANSQLGKGSEFWFELDLPLAQHEPWNLSQALAAIRFRLAFKDDLEQTLLARTLQAAGAVPVSGDADLVLDDDPETTGGVRLIARSPSGHTETQLRRPLCRDALIFRVQRLLDRAPAAQLTRTVREDRADRPDHLVRVLVAEDHPVNQRVIAQQLQYLGHQVTVVDDGRQALAALESDRFDLLLTDLQMPEMDGFQLSAAVRSQDRTAALPVIALSAEVDEAIRQRCEQAGMDRCLSKPLTLDHLRRILKELPSTHLSAAPGPLNVQVLDREQMAKTLGDAALVDEVLQDFLTLNTPQLHELKSCVAQRDTAAIELLAHRLLGSARTISAPLLAEALQGVEAATNQDPATLDAAMARVERCFHQLADAIREHLDPPEDR